MAPDHLQKQVCQQRGRPSSAKTGMPAEGSTRRSDAQMARRAADAAELHDWTRTKADAAGANLLIAIAKAEGKGDEPRSIDRPVGLCLDLEVPHTCSHVWGHASDTQLMQPYHAKYCRVCTAYVGAISIYNYDPDVPF